MPVESLRRELAAADAACARWARKTEDLYHKWCHERELRRAAEERLVDLCVQVADPPLIHCQPDPVITDNGWIKDNWIMPRITYRKLFGRLYWRHPAPSETDKLFYGDDK